MATLNALPGVSISISVAGQETELHKDNTIEDSDTEVIRFVEAKSNKPFSITCKVSGDHQYQGDILRFKVSIDGEWMLFNDVWAEKWSGKDYSDIIEGVKATGGGLRRFRFAQLKTVSEEDFVALDNASRVKDLDGLDDIQVAVSQLRKTSRVVESEDEEPVEPVGKGKKPQVQKPKPKKRQSPEPPAKERFEVVSEKDVKGEGLSHSVRLGKLEKPKHGRAKKASSKQRSSKQRSPQQGSDRQGSAQEGSSRQGALQASSPESELREQVSSPGTLADVLDETESDSDQETSTTDRPLTYWNTELVDKAREFTGIFVFRYRSLAALKTLLIVPRATKELSLQERYDRDPDSLNSKQMKRLLREWAEDRKAANNIKRESDGADPRPYKLARGNALSAPLLVDDDDVQMVPPPTRYPETIELDSD